MTTQQQYEILRKEFNEQQWRVFLGTEALKIGYGGISQVAARAASGLENGAARGKRTERRPAQSAGEDSPSRRWEKEGDGDRPNAVSGPGGVA